MDHLAGLRVPCAILAGIVIVFLWRALYFHLRYRFLRTVEERWAAYMLAGNPAYEDPSTRWLIERTRKVKRLLEEAHTDPGNAEFMTPEGYGYVAATTLGVLDNWLLKHREVTPQVRSALIRAQGHYKDERNRSLNPLDWIESLVFLPRNIISSLNPNVPKWVKDIFQIAYWIVVGVATVYKIAHQ